MKEIKLTQDKVTLVDDSDFPFLDQWKWSAHKHKNTWYAVRSQWNKETKKREYILMHRVILNTPDGILTDHENRNGLDNQRHNIRNATQSQNAMNKVSHSETGYLGVSYMRKKLKSGIIKKHIKATISINGKSKHLGLFPTEIEAAKAYDHAALEHHKEFANINFKN